MEVTVRTSALVSHGVHVGSGYVATTCHSLIGRGLTVNGYAAEVFRRNGPDDLALIYCEAMVGQEVPPMARKPRQAVASIVPHRGGHIAAYPTGRRSGKGASGSGYYEDGVLVGIVVGVQADGKEYAVPLERILETAVEAAK